jgi:hypothetical protein
MLFGIAAAPNAAQPQARPALQPVAILTVISGDVLMRSARGDFSSAVDGAVLYAGAMLRTSANARALITLFEGSTVELDPASDITIEDAATRGGSTVAQALGRGWNVVMRLTSADSRYEPSTPAATASVRGGEFEVAGADVTSGLMATPTVPEQHLATTVAVSAKTIAATQTTNARSNSAPVSMRSAVGAERIRKVVTTAVVSRARPAARSRDGAHEHDGAED